MSAIKNKVNLKINMEEDLEEKAIKNEANNKINPINLLFKKTTKR